MLDGCLRVLERSIVGLFCISVKLVLLRRVSDEKYRWLRQFNQEGERFMSGLSWWLGKKKKIDGVGNEK